MTQELELCAACGRTTEGNYSVHRDGFGIGPEVPLCDGCGGDVAPTLAEIWERIKSRREAQIDYWCRDCQDWFRSEQTPVHAPATKCPKCGGQNTYGAYEADTE